MKKIAILVMLIHSIAMVAQSDKTEPNKQERISNEKNIKTPLSLVQEQLEAYNKRDIEAFLKPFDDNVKAYIHPDTLHIDGKEEMRKIYSKIFKDTPNLNCQLVNRIVHGNLVIDKEQVKFGEELIDALVMYRIENNKIVEIYFLNNK